jgi:HSP20 family protein
MRALTPWTGFTTFKREMDRLFDRFGELEFPELPFATEWSPTLDVSETKDALVIKAEIPGIEPKDIQVVLQDQVLTIKGEKKAEREEKEEHHYRKERACGAFARSVRLPVPVDSGKVEATFKNGLLTITLPKTAAAKGTTIPIKAA